MMRSVTTSANRLHQPRAAMPAITVAGSARTEEWLSTISQKARRPWQIRRLKEGDIPQGILVLTQPGGFPESLHHRIAASQVVVSLDCPQGRSLSLSSRVQTFSFSEGRDAADLTAKDLRLTESGCLRFVAVTMSSLARVLLEDPDDLYPALAALACAVWLGAPLELACQVVSASSIQSEQLIKMA